MSTVATIVCARRVMAGKRCGENFNLRLDQLRDPCTQPLDPNCVEKVVRSEF
eukprot:gene23359-9636_t